MFTIKVIHVSKSDEDTSDMMIAKLNHLIFKFDQMAKTQAELAAELNSLATQLQKVGTESTKTLQKVTEMQAVIDSQGGVTEELQAAFDAVKAQVQAVDDLVVDTTEETSGTDTNATS